MLGRRGLLRHADLRVGAHVLFVAIISTESERETLIRLGEITPFQAMPAPSSSQAAAALAPTGAVTTATMFAAQRAAAVAGGSR